MKYKHKVFNIKLLYDLKTRFFDDLYFNRKRKFYTLRRGGYVFIKRTKNNFFLTSTDKKGAVIASFWSKLYTEVRGKRMVQSRELLQKLGFAIGFKSRFRLLCDACLVIPLSIQRNRLKNIKKGLRGGGLRLYSFYKQLNRAHNGCRGCKKRRV